MGVVSESGQLFYLELHSVYCMDRGVCVCVCERRRQTPVVKEKLAANLNLLREALLPGLSVDNKVFMLGAPPSSGGAEFLSVTAAASSAPEITDTQT